MKAVCVLLCLALPTAIVGRIFNPPQYAQFPPMGRMVVHPLDYIDQYQYKTSEDGTPGSNENSRESNADVGSYIQKYIEVLNIDAKKQRSAADKKIQDWNQLNAQARPNKLRQSDQLYQYQPQYQPQYPPQYMVEQQRESYEMPVREYKMQYGGDYPYDDSWQQKNKKSSQKYAKANKSDKKQKPKYKQAQYSSEQTSFQSSEESSEIPKYGAAISWRGISLAVSPRSPFVTKEDIEKIYGEAYTTMDHYTEEAKMQFHKNYEIAATLENEDIKLNATEMIRKHHYNVEEHTVKTDDGYILTLFRIAPNVMTAEKRPVVLLVHGLFGSADDWLLMGPGKSLAYILADAGFDVWLGNTRGSKYSRHHIAKHPALPDFWQYSNDEIALLDLPAMIDYTLETTAQQKLVYVGHSQGTTAFFALAASRPDYNDKIITMYALSPMAYMGHARSPLLKIIAPNSVFYERLREQIGRGEFKPSKALLSTMGGALCEKEVGCKFVCSNLNFLMSGVNMLQLNASLIPVILSHMPAGASVRQLKHYGQAVASNDFRMYDHGPEMNAKVYGAVEPPKYQLSAVTAPVSLFYSEEDWLASPMDVERMRRELPNVTESYKVPEKDFGSMDFQVGKSAPETVYKKIVDSIVKKTTTADTATY